MAEKGKEKVTNMKLHVDLECDKCYKKVKKVLCKFPQIRDPRFDEKSNNVIINVVSCSPERIMDKLCSKGGGSIKTIEIIKPPPKSQTAKSQSQTPPKKPPGPETPPQKPRPPQPIQMMPQWQLAICCGPYYDGYGMPPPQLYECYWRPVYDSWGWGCPPPPAYRPCHLIRCDYFSEDNPQSCSIM